MTVNTVTTVDMATSTEGADVTVGAPSRTVATRTVTTRRAAGADAAAVRAFVTAGVDVRHERPGDDDVAVVRLAVRDDDELFLLVHGADSWWVARRVDGVVQICAYIGDAEAERAFELFVASPSPRGAWSEVEVGATAA